MLPSWSTLGSPVLASIFGGMMPEPRNSAGCAVEVEAEATGVCGALLGRAIAISPGRITRNGKNILGIAAISGVRRAALMESAAMARCTTRKSVHQYPND